MQAGRNRRQIVAQVRAHGKAVCREQDVLRQGHDQPVAGVGDLHVAVHGTAQLCLLLVEVIADTRAHGTAQNGTDQRTVTTVAVVAYSRAQQCTGHSPGQRAGFGVTLGVVGVAAQLARSGTSGQRHAAHQDRCN